MATPSLSPIARPSTPVQETQFQEDSPYANGVQSEDLQIDPTGGDSPVFTVSHQHFHSLSSKLNGFDVSINTANVPLCIVNGIRRFSMNAIPIGGFKDEPPSHTDTDTRSIVIEKNNSLLYNEMLTTRIAMLPIQQDKLPRIVTKWDTSEEKRIYFFERQDEIPVVKFEIKSDSQPPGMKDITTDSIEAPDDFFVKDLVTNDPILLHCLMFPYPSIDIPLAFKAKPVIGTGKENSSFTPVGTTSMKFIVDEDKVPGVMEFWMNKKLDERKKKGLAPLSEDEIDSMKRNFLLLEKQRVYKQDSTGPTDIQLRIESLGNMKSVQIIRETLRMMAVQINDCWHTVKEDNISQTTGEIFEISLGKVDHTVAQCIVDAWKQEPSCKERTSLPSYRLTHPLKEEMILTIRMKDTTLKSADVLNMLHTCIAICVDDLSYLIDSFEAFTKTHQTPSHSLIGDSPDYWILHQTSIPLTTATILPLRNPRTSWTIAPSLLRSGS